MDGNNPLASTTESEHGPSWWDVRRASTELERESGGRVSYKLGPSHLTKRYTDASIHVTAELYRPTDTGGTVLYASASFGGNAGSRTMSAALYAALLNLWDRWEAQTNGGEAPAQEALPLF